MRNVSITHQLTALVLAAFIPAGVVWGQDENGASAAVGGNESTLLAKTRQLTFEGRRAGEGYFSADGSRMVFQSERDAANPFLSNLCHGP